MVSVAVAQTVRHPEEKLLKYKEFPVTVARNKESIIMQTTPAARNHILMHANDSLALNRLRLLPACEHAM